MQGRPTIEDHAHGSAACHIDDLADASQVELPGSVDLLLVCHGGKLPVLGVAPSKYLPTICNSLKTEVMNNT